MMTYRHVTVSMRIEHHVSALLAHGRATLHMWQQRRQARHDLRSLVYLDEWRLTDLGINRWAAVHEAQRPFWRPLALDGIYGEGPHARQTPGQPV
jgi:uncharacterized protein YjiS (DUF1127 family)